MAAAWKGYATTLLIGVFLLRTPLSDQVAAQESSKTFARVFSIRNVPSEPLKPEIDAPIQRSLLSSLWIPFKLPWTRDARISQKSPVDPINAILNNGSMSLNDTQIVVVENGGEAFRIIDTDVGEQQNGTTDGFPSSSNYTLPDEGTEEEVVELEVTDLPSTTQEPFPNRTTAEPYRPHKRPIIKSAGSTVVRNCHTSVHELEDRMRRLGKFNPLFMASTIEEAGLNFRSLLPPSQFGEPFKGFGSGSPVFFSHDAADEDEEGCDALCREFRDAAARALKERENPSMGDFPKTSPQMDAPPVSAYGGVQVTPYSERCTFVGNVKINSTCTVRGSATNGDENLSELCDKCIVIQSLGPGCFPSLFNTVSCIGDKTCLFDNSDYYYGQCTESVMYMTVFRNAPTLDGCDNWVTESIPIPVGCSCSLLRDRYSPLRAEK
ncbi:hypothetical protein L596_011542 [Steinernema carpocapsae]|uniref:Uncharacterized protein n=1 Tax=Steinernema carpocapsae TaxID=34508 RepID=A0A4U5NUM7_STECR|nr:hypothetical protein L596_011542 [Steinernema carpocapsae]